MEHGSPEHVVARLLAFGRTDDPGTVGERERKLAHAICEELRRAGYRILRQPAIKIKAKR